MASLYDKLVDIDENGEIVPMLAKSYDVSDDGKVYTFHLRMESSSTTARSSTPRP